MNYSTFTESKLLAAYEKASAERSAVCDAMIAADRGYETSFETLAKAKLPGADALTLRFAASCAVCGQIQDEKNRRMSWHGSLKRTKPAQS